MIATAIATILIGLASARVWGTERPSNVAELAAVGGQDEDAFLKQAAKDRLRAEREQVIAEIRGEILYDPAKVEQAGKLIGNRPADTQSDNIDRFLAAFALVETKFQGPYKLYRDALAQTDPDKAAATFAKAADAARLVLNSDDHTNLGAAGRYLYAAALKMAGRPIPAVEAFNKLAYDMPQRISFAAAATMEAARLYEALGRNIYAMDMYNYCLANYGLTLEPSQAKQIAGRVAELKALYDDPMKTLAGGMDQVHNRLTQFDTGDFRNGVPFVGWLERPGQQRIFLDRLRREFRIDAGRSKKDELLDIGLMRGLNDIRLNHEIIEEEIRRVRVIGKDSADLSGREDDHLWLGSRHPFADRVLLAQIDIATVYRQDFHVFARKPAHDRRANHAPVASDPDSPLVPDPRRKLIHATLLTPGRASS